jgi:hypothetical protein
MEKHVSDVDLNKLRQSGLLAIHEIAIVAGDVIVAENVLTKERRVLEVGNLLLESNKRILKG